MKGNRFFLQKGNKGILLIHGLTATTQEIDELATFLSRHDYTVSAPLLAGHNSTFDALDRTTWKDWYASIDSAYNDLLKTTDSIHVIGQSMGATLALHLAKEHTSIKSLTLLAPAIFYHNPFAFLSPLLQYFMPKKTKDYTKYYPHRKHAYFDIVDDKAIEERVAHKEASLAAIASSLQLIRHVKKELPTINCPALMFHSINDHTMQFKSSQFIYDKIASKRKEFVVLEKSGHVLSVDIEKQKIFDKIASFLTSIG